MDGTKKVKLPSGLEVEIAEPGSLGMRHLHGALPIFARSTEPSKRNGSVSDGEWAELLNAEVLLYDTAIRYVRSPKIVKKYPEECAPDEHSLELLSAEDIGALVRELIRFGGGGKEAQDALDPLSATATA